MLSSIGQLWFDCNVTVDLTSYRKQSKKAAGRATTSVISTHQLSKKSDRNINIQVSAGEETRLVRFMGLCMDLYHRLDNPMVNSSDIVGGVYEDSRESGVGGGGVHGALVFSC